jgi:hypothetical protein
MIRAESKPTVPFKYVETAIPAGMTIAEYRATRAPARTPRKGRLRRRIRGL